MKKLIGILIAVFIMAFANPYPAHLNGDPNYILSDGHMGGAWYVDRSSLSVEKYAPPEYVIAINVVTVQDADRGNCLCTGL